jgi:hypothetical protein
MCGPDMVSLGCVIQCNRETDLIMKNLLILVNISHNRFAGGSRDPDLSLLVKILLKWGWNGLTRSTTFFFYCHWKLERYFIICLYSVPNATKGVSNVKETWHFSRSSMCGPDMVSLGCVIQCNRETDLIMKNLLKTKSVDGEHDVKVRWHMTGWYTCTLHDQCDDHIWWA